MRAPVPINGDAYTVDPDLCTGCKVCLRAGCTSLSLYKNKDGDRGSRSTPSPCTGCGVCAQLCRYEAIVAPMADDGKDA